MSLTLIEEDIQRANRSMKKVGPIVLLVALVLGGASYQFLGNRTDDLQVALYGLAGIVGLLGLLFLGFGLRGPEASPLYRQLRADPNAILWVEPVRILRNGQHLNTRLTFHLRDGKNFTVQIAKITADRWLRVLQDNVAGLIIGSSGDERQAYQQRRAVA